MTDPDAISLEYLKAICAALDETSLRFGERGDMGAALAALSVAQAELISTLNDGRMRKRMREECARNLQRYIGVAVGDDKRGVSKPTLYVLPHKVH